LNLLTPGVSSMQTSTMALFRALADPILKTAGIPIYTIAGSTFRNDPLTLPTGLILRSLVRDKNNDGFVAVPRTRLSPDFAVDLGTVATDHYHTNNGTVVFPKIWARISGIETTLAGFERIAVNGFSQLGGSSSNAWAWTMKWFKGKLYVGTGRQVLCTTLLSNDIQTGTNVYPLAQLDDLCPTIADYPDRLAAEIWSYAPDTKEWRRVFQSPLTIPYGVDGNGATKFTARDAGFRGMAVFTEADGTEVLYVGGVTSGAVFGNLPPFSTQGFFPPRLLRTVDGETWTPVPQRLGTFLGNLGQVVPGRRNLVSFRSLTSYKGKLFATVGDYRGVGQIIASANPSAGDDAWYLAAPSIEQFPVWNLHVFNNYLYVTTGDGLINTEGYGVYKTDAEGPPPYTYLPIVVNGAYQTNPTFRSTQGMTFMEFNGQLYQGTNRPTELIRINPDDTWDLVVGEPRMTPLGMKEPISGLGIGFGSWFNGHFWRMAVHDGQLYLGTWDWSIGLKGLGQLDSLFGFQYGFDVYRTPDGVHWTAVTKTGFGDPYNYGGRTFEDTPFGLFIGTARQRGGLQVFHKALDRPPSILAAPTNVESESETVAGRMAILHWEPAPGAVRYRVYRSKVAPLTDLLPPTLTVTLPGSDTPITLQDIRDGKLDHLCPGALGETTMCEAVRAIKTTDDAVAPAGPGPVLPVAFPQPWVLVGVTDNPTYTEPAPTALESLYHIRAEDAAGNLSEPSNFVGAPSKAAPGGLQTPEPEITASISPGPNALGWNNTDVRVTWITKTPGAGLVSATGCDTTAVSVEGATTLTCSVKNSNGQQAEKSVVIRIDRTPPTLSSSASPAPNGNGWHNTETAVTFSAVDTLSGVATVTSPTTVGTEGAAQAISGTATDLAGNSASTVRVVNIDRTPPEVTFRFDLATRDLVAVGRDAMSGVANPIVRPSAIVNARWQWLEDDDDGEAPWVGPGWLPQQRTYRAVDRAGNSVVLVTRTRHSAHELRGRLLTLQYNASPSVALPWNAYRFLWTVNRHRAIQALVQRIVLGRRLDAYRITGWFTAARNTTRLRAGGALVARHPGLFLLGLVTTIGKLSVQT
jgi:hypothetical protein